jgi:hypothetical protein
MATRDGAASIQGDMIRITPLLLDGSIDTSRPILTTNGFITASFGTEFEDGDEITEKAADGSVCIQYKADDSLKGITFNLSLCTPDPEATALIAGGMIICATEDVLDDDDNVVVAAGDVVGYSSPTVGATVGNPVAIEIWSKAIVKGKPAAGTPYWHWAFPYVRVRYEGDREFTNGALANEYSGTGVGNEALAGAGLNSANPGDDFVTYKQALVNPFSYVRSTSKPDISGGHWSGGPGNAGEFDKTAANSIGCVAVATGATMGTPGTWTPPGSVAPANIAGMSAVVASPTTAWTAGTYVVLGDSSQAHWTSAAWAVGPGTGLLADDQAAGQAGGFDPGEHTVAEVEEYLADHPDERDSVLGAERAGKNRSTLVGDE